RAQIGAGQIGAVEIGGAQIGGRELRLAQHGVLEDRAMKSRASQIGATEIVIAEIGGREIVIRQHGAPAGGLAREIEFMKLEYLPQFLRRQLAQFAQPKVTISVHFGIKAGDLLPSPEGLD